MGIKWKISRVDLQFEFTIPPQPAALTLPIKILMRIQLKKKFTYKKTKFCVYIPYGKLAY